MITKIKWKNHLILGNLELDFTDGNGNPYGTIILAGENGTGKTTILETLSIFLNLGEIKPFDYIEYKVAENHYHISAKTETDSDFGFHHRKNLNDNSEVYVHSNKNNNPDSIKTDIADLRHYGFAYTKARSGFKTNSIKNSSTEQLDNNKYNIDSNDDFTNIKQLLVDIDTQDNAAWMKITKNGEPTTFEEFKSISNMYRFEHAFNNFFDKIKFKEIDNTSSTEKKIIFEKDGKNIPLDSLSTGEKQIIFRGTQLLRNVNTLNGGTILIDEPELSMHPKWQEKILNYYRGLFTQNNSQTSQIFLATHSEYVLRSALQDRNNVLIITLSESNGILSSNKVTAPSILPCITAAETNYLAFGIVSIDYHIQLYGYLQSKENKPKIKSCDNFIASHSLYDASKYSKPSSYYDTVSGRTTHYQTLPTYIRNAIDHPDSGNTYTDEELKLSIEFLIELCR